jgi:hypothetical protein
MRGATKSDLQVLESEMNVMIPSVKERQANVIKKITDIHSTLLKPSYQSNVTDPYSSNLQNEAICQVNYNFNGLRSKHARIVMKCKLPEVSPTQDLLRNRHLAIKKHALGPSPETYSLDAM